MFSFFLTCVIGSFMLFYQLVASVEYHMPIHKIKCGSNCVKKKSVYIYLYIHKIK